MSINAMSKNTMSEKSTVLKNAVSKNNATPIFTHLSWISILIVSLICYVHLQYTPTAGMGSLLVVMGWTSVAGFFTFVFSLAGMFRRERLVVLRWILLVPSSIVFVLFWIPWLRAFG